MCRTSASATKHEPNLAELYARNAAVLMAQGLVKVDVGNALVGY